MQRRSPSIDQGQARVATRNVADLAEPGTMLPPGYRRRKRVRHDKAQGRRKLLWATVGLVAAFSAASGAGGYLMYQELKGEGPWPTLNDLTPTPLEQTSFIYDVNGNRIGAVASDIHRTPVRLGSMGQWTADALVAIEDRRFYEHDGFDVTGMARAAHKNIKARRVVEGASTITQQTVRLVYQEIDQEQTFRRKAREITLARELEERWDKQRILQAYLNRAYFGHQAYGIEAAAQTYFAKPASRLTLPESALLVGLVQKPSQYDPFRNRLAAKQRRQDVLRAMHETGVIDDEQYHAALRSKVELKRGKLYTNRVMPHYFDFVQRELEQRYGVQRVRYGGLRTYTTIDRRMQQRVAQAINGTLDQPNDPAAAIVVLDNRNGAIRAMATNLEYTQSRFNVVTQGRRQPGSSAKIWTLAAFLEQGYDPNQARYVSAPLEVRPQGSTEFWKVKTYDNSYPGAMDVARATVRSDNSVFAQMTMDLGPRPVVRTARAMGINTPLEEVYSISLGSQAVTPLEQTNFYATIARGGIRQDPFAVRKVTTAGGAELKNRVPGRKRVISAWSANQIIRILETNVRAGTGTAANIGRASAGKTGTTDDYGDAWYCGMTPEVTACVWVGYPDRQRPMTNVRGIRVTGGSFPAQIWGAAMGKALQGVPQRRWPAAGKRPRVRSHSPTWNRSGRFEVRQGPGRGGASRSQVSGQTVGTQQGVRYVWVYR